MDKIYEIIGNKNLSYYQYKYHFINNNFIIPKCKYSDENCFFNINLNKYECCSKKYYKFIKIDKNIKCKWLTFEYLLDIGFTLTEIQKIKENKLLFKLRLFFAKTKFTKKEIINRLVKNYFTINKANELAILLISNNKDNFISSIYELNRILKIKNYDVNYWINRGYSLNDAKEILKEFFNAGSKKIKEKRNNSIIYDNKFRKSRQYGIIASHTINCKENNIYISKIEKKIKDELEKKYKNDIFFTPCVNEELKQFYNKQNFIHDFFINNKFIIEYNGGYWHKDFINFNQFTKEDYMFEIKKAYNCIFEVKRKNNLNYIIIWENDFKSIKDIIKFIDKIILLNENQTFYSSRNLDIDLFNNFKYEFDKKQKEIQKFKKIIEIMSEESHCLNVKVAAIAVKNNRIISTGINGTPSKYINCDDYFKYKYKSKNILIPFEKWINTIEWKKNHHKWSLINEVHAEISLIGEAAKNGISLNGCDIYVTHQPCTDCTKILIAAGVSNIYYINDYGDINDNRKRLLNNCKIKIEKIKINKIDN